MPSVLDMILQLGSTLKLSIVVCSKIEYWVPGETSPFLLFTNPPFARLVKDKTRQDTIYFELARHITINISSRALLFWSWVSISR